MLNLQSTLARYFQQPDKLQKWTLMFKSVLELDLGPLEEPTEDSAEIDSRDKHSFWKLKATLSKASLRLLQRFGTPQISLETKAQADAFAQSICAPLLDSHLGLVLKRSQKFIGSKALFYSLRYLSTAVNSSITLQPFVIPHFESLLYEGIPLMLYLTHKEYQEATEDEQEYVRRSLTTKGDCESPKRAAQDLLRSICSFKTPETRKQGKSAPPDLLAPFLQFACTHLATFQASQGTADFRIKDALLLGIEALAERIEKHKVFNTSVEDLLQTYVFPDLASSNLFLRLRALSCYNTFNPVYLRSKEHA